MNKPNVIVFLTDQQRWDTMGLHGNPLDLTPNLDYHALRHTHLANCFTPQPVCGPARGALQTGVMPSASGCMNNGDRLPENLPCLGSLFRDAGYRTGYIGKWHLAGGDQPKGPVAPDRRGGYDEWLGADVLEAVSTPYDCTVFDGEGREHHLPGYRSDALADAGIRFLQTNKDRPFFLFISLLEPHQQNSQDDYPPPQGTREHYVGRWMPPDLEALGGSSARHLAGYWGMVKRIDEAYGRIHDALLSLGLDQNTITLFTSDHGCHFRTRNSEYKRTCHESSIRVPGVLTGPMFAGGGHRGELVSLIDFAPTLLDAADIPVPPTMQGRSILTRLDDRSAPWREEVLSQFNEDDGGSHPRVQRVGRTLRTQRWKYAVSANVTDTTLRHYPEYVESHLYDLEHDPYELENLIDLPQARETCETLRERLHSAMTAVGEPACQILPTESSGRPGQRKLVPGTE